MPEQTNYILEHCLIESASNAFFKIKNSIPKQKSTELLSILANSDAEVIASEIGILTNVYKDIKEIRESALILIGAMALIANTETQSKLLEKFRSSEVDS